MIPDRWIAIWTAFALLVYPALSLADHHQAGGVAEEHRSDKAAEKSNAQWDEDNAGRPEKIRGEDDDEAVEDGDKGRKEEKGTRGKKGTKNKNDHEGDHRDDHEDDDERN